MIHRTPFLLVVAAVLAAAMCVAGCKQRSSAPVYSAQDSAAIVRDNQERRAQINSTFANDPDSPFNRDTSVRFHGLNWYPLNLTFIFRSRLYRYDSPQPVTILGTKGEERHQIKYGYFIIPWEEKEYKLNVYRSAEPGEDPRAQRNLSLWFTDATTGKETYGVGRYLDVGEEARDQAHIYTLDFNKCYNPYCAYSPLYSCAVPRQEDRLDFAVLAGEKKYHD